MKKFLFLLLILISFFNCKQNTKNLSSIENVSDEKFESHRNVSLEFIAKKVKVNIPEAINREIQLDTFIPLEILNSKEKDVYKKYGLEFIGNCYDCDLAEFQLVKNKISISNVCDYQNKLSFDIIKTLNTEDKIEIETENYNFIFLRMEDEPIFKLKIINKDFKNSRLRISEYFTFKRELSKFEAHDCQGFEG